MAYTLIIGPMKSGKSLELIGSVAPHEFAKKKVLYVKPTSDTRETAITSRLGVETTSLAVDSLRDITEDFDVIGIDEAHMFPATDIPLVSDWIKAGKEVIAAGLDLDYRGQLQPTIQKLLELKPDNLISKLAVCDVCNKYEAKFSQILSHGEPVLEGLPQIISDDGKEYVFQARCRNCFVTI